MNTRLVNSAAGVVNAALARNVTAAGVAMALESAGLLMSPETAAELARLRSYAAAQRVREEELLASMGHIDLREAPETWALGMTVLSHLDGPVGPSAPEGLEPGLRALIRQLRARVAELEAEPRDRPVDEDPIAYALTPKAVASADKLTRLLAPTQALREDPHESPLHHDYRMGRDLPESGGAR